jgi:hypothetical protein
MTSRAWPLLAVSVGAAWLAAIRLMAADRDTLGGIAAVASLILLGAWVAMECRDR